MKKLLLLVIFASRIGVAEEIVVKPPESGAVN